MFTFGDYIDRVPIFLPPGYEGFNDMPTDYDPYQKPKDEENAEPTNWVLMISGSYFHTLLIQTIRINVIITILGSQPGMKLNETAYIILTKSTNLLLHNYRMLRRLRFPEEGKLTYYL